MSVKLIGNVDSQGNVLEDGADSLAEFYAHLGISATTANAYLKGIVNQIVNVDRIKNVSSTCATTNWYPSHCPQSLCQDAWEIRIAKEDNFAGKENVWEN